jgi:predicted alpha/beta superfamily hydrolase
MKNKLLFVLFLMCSLVVQAQYQVRFEIKSLPANSSSDADIFLAGSFNNWNPQNQEYKFKKDSDGNYFLEIVFKADSYEYKLTKGSWEKAECKQDGASVENRSMRIDKSRTVEIDIQGWADNFIISKRISSAGKNVHIMDTAFYMPQLNRYRRVWVYLPESYQQTSKKYPVLYMHDGQNVFEDTSSYSGEWGVDKALDSLGKQVKECIVIAVDNGMGFRMNEYSPYDLGKYGKGVGADYVDFLVKTLKPYIDKNYRTRTGRKNTGIAGSSMGGLISMFAVMQYPEVFGAGGVFSPSFWIAPKLNDELDVKGKRIRTKLYFYMGDAEGDNMIKPMNDFVEQLKRTSKAKTITVIKDGGKHHESAWRKEFPDFYRWMMSR